MVIPTSKVAAKVIRHSPAQLNILRLYRHMLRNSKNKDQTIYHAIKSEFKKNKTIPKTNILSIEFHTRKAEKNLDLLKDGNITKYSS